MPSPGAATKKALSALKLQDLKHLALSIGAGSSGTKDVLRARLWDELQRPGLQHGAFSSVSADGAPKMRERKILSIDMGIKNFAYATLALPEQWSVPFPLSGAAPSPKAAAAGSAARPKLLEWNRLNMLTYRVPAEPQSAPDTVPADEAEGEVPTTDRDQFTPAKLAAFANYIVERLVLRPASAGGPPDTVLIERQRFRTMGAASVQEWTLRVNMLEAMLWAVLRAESARGSWRGAVHAVSPSLVAGWWQARSGGSSSSGAEVETKDKKLSAKQKKQVRVERAAECLRDAVDIADPAAQATYAAYLRRMARAKGQRAKAKDADAPADGAQLQKLDDLADSLLQALTWLAWEQNRRALLATDTAAEALRSLLPAG